MQNQELKREDTVSPTAAPAGKLLTASTSRPPTPRTTPSRPPPSQANPLEKKPRTEDETSPTAADSSMTLKTAPSNPPQPSQKATFSVHTPASSVVDPRARLVALLHDKCQIPAEQTERVLVALQKDGSWIKRTSHVEGVLETQTPSLEVCDLADVFDFEYAVESAHGLLAQVFSDSEHRRAVLFGYENQGKTQVLNFIMKLLQGLGEFVALLDEYSTNAVMPWMESSESHWSRPFRGVLEVKIEAMEASAQDAGARSLETTELSKAARAAAATELRQEIGDGIAEEAFIIAEEISERAASVTDPGFVDFAVEMAKRVQAMESAGKLTREDFSFTGPATTKAQIVGWTLVFANRIVSYTQPEKSIFQVVHSDSLEERIGRTFRKLTTQLYLLAAKLYRIDARADVVPATRSEVVDAATDVCDLARQLHESRHVAEDIQKIAACAYQVGLEAMHQDDVVIYQDVVTLSFEMAAKFYKALAIPNEGSTATMSADAYELASTWYQWVATTNQQAADKLADLFSPRMLGLSDKVLVEDLSSVAALGHRVWVLVDNLPEWKDLRVLHCELFPQDRSASPLHFVVTGGVGMGTWTASKRLEDFVVDLPFLSKDAGWRLATKLASKLDVDDLEQRLCGDLEASCGGIPGYIADFVLDCKRQGSTNTHFLKLETDLTLKLESVPDVEHFAYACLKAIESNSSDPWRVLRREGLCGRLPPRGAIDNVIRKWLDVLKRENRLQEPKPSLFGQQFSYFSGKPHKQVIMEAAERLNLVEQCAEYIQTGGYFMLRLGKDSIEEIRFAKDLTQVKLGSDIMLVNAADLREQAYLLKSWSAGSRYVAKIGLNQTVMTLGLVDTGMPYSLVRVPKEDSFYDDDRFLKPIHLAGVTMQCFESSMNWYIDGTTVHVHVFLAREEHFDALQLGCTSVELRGEKIGAILGRSFLDMVHITICRGRIYMSLDHDHLDVL